MDKRKRNRKRTLAAKANAIRAYGARWVDQFIAAGGLRRAGKTIGTAVRIEGILRGAIRVPRGSGRI